MKQSLAQLQQWFNGLESRERLLVSIGAVVGGLTLLYLLIWEPVAKAHLHREADLVTSRQLANRIERLAGQTNNNASGGSSRVESRSAERSAALKKLLRFVSSRESTAVHTDDATSTRVDDDAAVNAVE